MHLVGFIYILQYAITLTFVTIRGGFGVIWFSFDRFILQSYFDNATIIDHYENEQFKLDRFNSFMNLFWFSILTISN